MFKIRISLTLCILGALIGQPVYAYKQGDLVRLTAPQGTPIKMFLGYNSNTGEFVEQCVGAAKFRTIDGVDPAGHANFKFVRSLHEVMSEQEYDVSVKLRVQGLVAGGEVAVDVSEYKKNQSQLEQGMVYGVFRDSVKPKFISPNAKFRFNEFGAGEYRAAIKKGRLKRFRQQCGDSVVVGLEKERSIKVSGGFSNSSSASQSERELNMKASANYLMSKFSANVSLSEADKNRAERKNIKLSYTTSGNARVKGATNLRQLKRVWREFSELPLKNTLTISRFYIVPYKQLLPASEFDLGLSRKELNKVEKIINGAMVIDHARVVAALNMRKANSANEKARFRTTRDRLAKEFRQVSLWLKDKRGCIGKLGDGRVCNNLAKRFANFGNVENRASMREFVKLAARGTRDVCAYYPITGPSGRHQCKTCGLAKQPIFLNGRGGECGYLAKELKPDNAVRLWAKNLKTTRQVEVEAGVVNTLAEYPNYCNKNNKKCGAGMAEKLCKAAGYGSRIGHQVWHPGGLGVLGAKPRTVYPNGSRCKATPKGFDKKLCKTYVYIDCAT